MPVDAKNETRKMANIKKGAKDLSTSKHQNVKIYKKQYIENVKNKLPITDVNDSIDMKSQKIVDALNQAATNTVPRSPANITREIWKNDTELNSALRERTKFERNSDSYKDLSKKIKNGCRSYTTRNLKKGRQTEQFFEQAAN